MNATAHQAARSLLEALQQLRFDQPLAADDERYVDTAEARGDFKQAKIIRSLEACLAGGEGHGHYYLYSGHIGCGKSTELRRLAAKILGSGQAGPVRGGRHRSAVGKGRRGVLHP